MVEARAKIGMKEFETPRSTGASIVGHGVTKVFGTGPDAHHALGPIDLAIKPGEFVSLIGPSGCGKSTTMLLVAGLEQATEGVIEIDGTPLSTPISDVGIVFQDHLLLEFRTAIKNVMLQQEIRRLDKRMLRDRADTLFAKLGLSGAGRGRDRSMKNSSTIFPGPVDMTSTRSDRPTASSIEWVINRTVFFVSNHSISRSWRICVRVIASSAPNGSSISSIDGS